MTDDPHKSYLDERRAIESSEADAAKSFDQAMLTLSGGALGLSVTFIEHIAPRPLPWTLWILFPGMLFLGFSLALTLASFLISQYACRQSRHDLDRLYDAEFAQRFETESIDDWWVRLQRRLPSWLAGKRRRWGEAVDRLNLLSTGFFVAGVLFLVLFSVSNIRTKETSMADDRNKAIQNPGDQRGYRGPTPAAPPPKNDPPPSTPKSDKK